MNGQEVQRMNGQGKRSMKISFIQTSLMATLISVSE